ncbi:MAG: hypothetical protein WAT67_09490 [Candidatus Contendobacter sp.]
MTKEELIDLFENDFDIQIAIARGLAKQAALKGEHFFSELLVQPLKPPFELTLEDVRGTSLESEWPL